VTKASDHPAVAAPHSQTLSRGVRVLEILAEAPGALSIADLSAALGVHRSIAYRILRTLEDHGLVIRDGAGLVLLGPRLAALARGVYRDLQSAVLPELTSVANELGMTAFLVVLDQRECVTLASIEPRHGLATVGQRPGTRHPIERGAPGIAIQSSLSAREWAEIASDTAPRAEVETARSLGYATSHDEVIPGISSVSVALRVPGQPPAALAVVYVSGPQQVADIGHRLQAAVAATVRDLA
jgi:DNA-binding IclR family transcriptional regulator